MPAFLMRCHFIFGGLIPALLLAGCSTVPEVGARIESARQKATAASLRPLVLEAGALPLRGFARLDCSGEPVRIYIEGDGYAWVTISQPSPNPTPVNPVALTLAVADPACNVVYLGRPGQYVDGGVDARYWLSARFAPEVVDSYVLAVERLLATSRTTAVHLVGYSGGGAVAALVAARLQRRQALQVTLSTVAGNLDTEAWTRMRRLTPLAGSLNPAADARALASVPQLHLTGRRDRQVSGAVLESFLRHMPSRRCVRVVTVEADHAGPWEEVWRASLATPPLCQAVDAADPGVGDAAVGMAAGAAGAGVGAGGR